MFPLSQTNDWWSPAMTYVSVTMLPTGEPVPLKNGTYNLCPQRRAAHHPALRAHEQGRRVFGQLAQPNVFTAPTNTFQGVIEVNQCNISSDVRLKSDVHRLDETRAMRMLETVHGYSYVMHDAPAAGFLAHEVPDEYTRTSAVNGFKSVNYNAMVAELWTAVQCLSRRVRELESGAAAASIHTASVDALCVDNAGVPIATAAHTSDPPDNACDETVSVCV